MEKRQMYYKQNENIDENRFITGVIKEIHDLLIFLMQFFSMLCI